VCKTGRAAQAALNWQLKFHHCSEIHVIFSYALQLAICADAGDATYDYGGGGHLKKNRKRIVRGGGRTGGLQARGRRPQARGTAAQRWRLVRYVHAFSLGTLKAAQATATEAALQRATNEEWHHRYVQKPLRSTFEKLVQHLRNIYILFDRIFERAKEEVAERLPELVLPDAEPAAEGPAPEDEMDKAEKLREQETAAAYSMIFAATEDDKLKALEFENDHDSDSMLPVLDGGDGELDLALDFARISGGAAPGQNRGYDPASIRAAASLNYREARLAILKIYIDFHKSGASQELTKQAAASELMVGAIAASAEQRDAEMALKEAKKSKAGVRSVFSRLRERRNQARKNADEIHALATPASAGLLPKAADAADMVEGEGEPDPESFAPTYDMEAWMVIKNYYDLHPVSTESNIEELVITPSLSRKIDFDYLYPVCVEDQRGDRGFIKAYCEEEGEAIPAAELLPSIHHMAHRDREHEGEMLYDLLKDVTHFAQHSFTKTRGSVRKKGPAQRGGAKTSQTKRSLTLAGFEREQEESRLRSKGEDGQAATVEHNLGPPVEEAQDVDGLEQKVLAFANKFNAVYVLRCSRIYWPAYKLRGLPAEVAKRQSALDLVYSQHCLNALVWGMVDRLWEHESHEAADFWKECWIPWTEPVKWPSGLGYDGVAGWSQTVPEKNAMPSICSTLAELMVDAMAPARDPKGVTEGLDADEQERMQTMMGAQLPTRAAGFADPVYYSRAHKSARRGGGCKKTKKKKFLRKKSPKYSKKKTFKKGSRKKTLRKKSKRKSKK